MGRDLDCMEQWPDFSLAVAYPDLCFCSSFWKTFFVMRQWPDLTLAVASPDWHFCSLLALTTWLLCEEDAGY